MGVVCSRTCRGYIKMAARRIAASSIDWAAFSARVPAGQKASFNAFKGKSDGYLRKVVSLPESAPAIDFSAYKARIAIPGMVENFQKQYEALSIAYPEDVYSSKIDEVQAAAVEDVKAFISESEGRISKLTQELAHWEGMIPYDQMTLEEWAVAFPDQAIDVENPTMWPHGPEDQPGYVAKEGAEA